MISNETLRQRIAIAINLLLAVFLIVFSFVSPPEVYRVFNNVDLGAGGVTLQGFNLPVILCLMGNYMLVALFGYFLIRQFFLALREESVYLKYIASFFVGYTCILGIIRIVSLMATYQSTYWYVLGIVVLYVVYNLILLSVKTKNTNLSISWDKKKVLKAALIIILAGVSFFFLLMLQIRQGEFSWAGHGPGQYSFWLEMWSKMPMQHFPILKQHYDELIFHYFISSPIQTSFNTILPWWLTLAVVKISIFVFIYMAFLRVGIQRIYAIVFTLFMFFGTTSLNASKYYMLFDSSNPALYSVHVGRLIGVGLVIMFLTFYLTKREEGFHLSFVFYILCGLGLSATSISNMFWFLIIYICWVILDDFYVNQIFETRNVKVSRFGSMLCWSTVFTAILLYSLRFSGGIFFALRFICVVGVICLLGYRYHSQVYFFFKNLKNTNNEKSALLSRLSVLTASLLIGCIFLGNIFVDNSWARLVVKKLESIFGKIYFAAAKDTMTTVGNWAIGDHRELAAFNEHNQGVGEFVAYYGGILFIILVTNLLFQAGRKHKRISDVGSLALYDIFLICCVGVVVFLFFMDFINFGSRGWPKSRFLEIPIYLILFCFFYYVYYCTRKYVRIIILSFLVLYILIPIFKTDRIGQIKNNTRVFNQLLLESNESSLNEEK